MAVMTYTRRQVVDMFPEYLTKRGGAVSPSVEKYAGSLGIPRMSLVALFNGWLMCDAAVLTRQRVAFRSPYALKWSSLDEQWAELTRAGFAEPIEAGWHITSKGDAAVQELQRRFREALRGLPVPPEPTARAAKVARRMADRTTDAALRALWAKRRPRPAASEPPSDLVGLDLAVMELWWFRDDCHIEAWQEAGYDGPSFDVLSHVWSSPGDVTHTRIGGHETVEALAKALEARQDRADVERHLDGLVRRGDLERDGAEVRLTAQGKRSRDAIEVDTDRRYFAIWDLDDAATSRFGDDLHAIIEAMPKA